MLLTSWGKRTLTYDDVRRQYMAWRVQIKVVKYQRARKRKGCEEVS